MSLDNIKRAIQPMRVMIGNLLVRAILRGIDDSKAIQWVTFEALEGEVRDGVERLQDYGFTSVPPIGSRMLVASVGGSSEHLVCVRSESQQKRMKGLQQGESAQYSDEGDYLLLKRGRIVVLNVGTEARLGSDNADDPLVRKSDLQKVVDKFNAHTHPATTTATTGAGVVGAITMSAPTQKAAAFGSDKLMAD